MVKVDEKIKNHKYLVIEGVHYGRLVPQISTRPGVH
jgi:hypothetical protein